MSESTPLTANSAIGDWLDSPTGGPMVRGLLEKAGVPESMLAPVRSMPMQQLVAMSQGQLTQETVDDLVKQVGGDAA